MNQIPTPRPALRMTQAFAYAPGGRRPHMDLLLDANEGAAPPAALLEALGRVDPELLRRYPNARPLEALIARRFGLAAEQVIVTAGADDALYRASMAMLEPQREVILPTPTFEMLPRYARLAGATVIEVPWVTPAFPVESVLAAITPATAMIAVVSPNNPTGTIATEGELRAVAAAAPHALIAVDLAYGEFADTDLTTAALALPNAVVFRSFSKAWGLAGLRVGYAMGPAPLIALLRAAGNPFSVTSLSVALVTHRLHEEDRAARPGGAPTAWGASLEAFRTRVQLERVALRERLEAHGAEVWPAEGNFVLARFRNASWFRDGLAGLGIGVRAFPDRPEIADCVRITCPCDRDRFERLRRAIDVVLSPEVVFVESPATAERLRAALADRGTLRKPPDIRAARSPDASALLATVREAGTSRAWAVVSDPSSVAALRGLGVLPVAEAAGAVGEDPTASRLCEAGASRVIPGVEAVVELIP